MSAAGDDWLAPLVGQQVVADLGEFYLVLGTLVAATADSLEFRDAELHDHREANSTKEVYVLETRSLGIRANRARLWVPRRQLVAISRLADVLG
jgi:hypothetical protein